MPLPTIDEIFAMPKPERILQAATIASDEWSRKAKKYEKSRPHRLARKRQPTDAMYALLEQKPNRLTIEIRILVVGAEPAFAQRIAEFGM